MTTVAGSAEAMGAISTTPAPTRLRRLVPLLLVDCRREVSRLTSTRPVVDPVPLLPRDARETAPDPELPADAWPAEREREAEGAIPQVSQ
jgi:hypothetical protein